MKQTFSEWIPVERYCCNCGKKMLGYRDKEGVARMQCTRCQVSIISIRKSRRREQIEVIAPVGQTALA